MKKIISLLAIGLLIFNQNLQAQKEKFNVLFIAFDDLKPYINSFGYKAVKTPNIDKLAQYSTIFNGNYCQQAVCAPTRASLLSGSRPDKTKIWDLKTQIRDMNPDITTLPQYFKANGYVTSAMGKIFDPRSVDKGHDSISWSIPYKNKFKLAVGYEDLIAGDFQSAAMKAKYKQMLAEKTDKTEVNSIREALKVSTESEDIPDDAYYDGAMTNYAIQQFRNQKSTQQPFFMSVGFHKPHLPFVAPKKYWDMYDRNKIELASWQKKAIDGPDVAYHNAGEVRAFKDIELLMQNEVVKKDDLLKLPEAKQRELIHGYYACISYLDAQVGKLLEGLKAEGLDKNTIIVFWGDHGWHFGDHSLWAKHSNFEQATKAPLMFTVPNLTKGTIYTQPTEFVDIFPTLCDLTGIPKPNYLDGKSLLPAMKDNKIKIKDYAISQYPRGGSTKDGNRIMGYSLRNERYRYTEWIGSFFTTAKPFDEKQIVATELYDLTNDPNETVNIVAKSESKKALKDLEEKLHDYYKQQYSTAGKIN